MSQPKFTPVVIPAKAGIHLLFSGHNAPCTNTRSFTSLSKPLAERPPHRLLLIQPGALGDSLLTLPIADSLSKAFPQLSIEILGHLDYISLFPRHRAVSSVADIDTAPLHLLFAEPPGELPAVFADYLARFDAALTWLGQPHSHFCRNLSAAVAGPVICIDRGPPCDYPQHVVHYWLSQLFENPPLPQQCDYQLRLSNADISASSEQLSSRLAWPVDQTEYIIFHPGAGSAQKTWPVPCFAQLASRITEDTNYRIVYLLGPAETERFDARIISLLNSTGQVLSDLDIPQAAALISHSLAFLGHDSGPTHLAAALSIRTLAIFGPSNPTHWQPLAPSAQIISTPNQSPLCSQSLTIDGVYDALQNVLD